MRRNLFLGLSAACALSGAAAAQTPEVIFCELSTSSKSDVPGASVATKWKALEDFNVSHDGAFWVVKGRSLNGTDEALMVYGNQSLSSIVTLAEESQTIPGNAPLQWDFYDTPVPVSWDLSNNMALSFRSKGGPSSTHEKLMWIDAGLTNFDIVLSESDPLVGCSDQAPDPAGDETVGNSVGSVSGLESGEIFFGVTPINNCHSNYRPGLFITDVANTQANKFLQSRADSITHFNGTDPIDGFAQGDGTMTPDGLHWVMETDIENEPDATDKSLVVDGVVVLQEGFVNPGSSLATMADIFQTRMVSNGFYITRGDDAADNDFAFMNGATVLETGQGVPFSLPGENIGNSIAGVTCNRFGDWLAIANTDNANPGLNEVLLFNGEIIAREGDPIDIDGNGLFDDGAFIGRAVNTLTAFNANDLYLTDDLYAYFICTLNDGAGNDLEGASPTPFGGPDSFMRVRLESPSGNNVAFCFGNAAECPCGNGGSGLGGCDNAQGTGGVIATLTGFTPDNLGGGSATITGTGFPPLSEPTAIVIRSPFPETPPDVFGDGLRCVSALSLVRLAAAPAIGGTSQHVFGHGAGAGSFFYQLWYRNTPSTFCDSTAAFNLSNGYRVTW